MAGAVVQAELVSARKIRPPMTCTVKGVVDILRLG